jgi:hypothetical protein
VLKVLVHPHSPQFAHKGGTRGKGMVMERPQGREHVRFDVYVSCGHGRTVNELLNLESVRRIYKDVGTYS